MTPLIQSVSGALKSPCSSCGGQTAEIVNNLLEGKRMTFIVQVAVDNVEDVLDLTREKIAAGKVLSASPQNKPAVTQTGGAPNRVITGQHQSTTVQPTPVLPAQGGNNG